MPDVELGKIRDGYPALAQWVAQDPDDDPLIFRKFGRVSARSILNLQCQICALEAEIDDLDDQARNTADIGTRQSLQRWETMMANAKVANSVESQLVEKLNTLHALLKDYYEMLALRAQVAEFNKPSDRALAAYDDFLKGRFIGGSDDNPMSLIYGRASKFLEDKQDLVALRKPSDEDYLSRFLRDHWLFQKRKSADMLDRTTIYKNSHVVRTVAALDMVLAAILLIGAIVNLYLVPDPKAKLGLVAMYTFLFASSVAICTNARRAEVFAATAAYAAVLVVFVSGELGGSKNDQCFVQLDGGMLKSVRCPN